MEIKKGDKVRVISNKHTTAVHGAHKFPIGTEVSVEEKDCGSCWCYSGSQGWWVHADDLELVENQEYLTMRGLGKQVASLYQKGIECNICDPLFPDENPNIRQTFLSLHDLLQFKNKRYGNSSLEPINVLSKADSTTGLLQRADDKIARIKNSPELRKNDVADLIGYLVLICVSKGWDNFDEFKD